MPKMKGPRLPHWLVRVFPIIILVLSGCVFSGFPVDSKAADNLVAAATAGTTPVPAPEPATASDVTNLANVLDDKYHLAIGDQLSFRILEDEDDPKIIGVTDSGDLEVPYIGRYPAAGKTCKALAQELKVELEKKYYLHATVVIAVDSKPKSRGKVYLVGAIGAPGAQDMSSEENLTVSKAILRAGGLTSFADGKDVRVTRILGTDPENETNFTVNVSQIYEQGKTKADLPLKPGDLIFVPERMIRF